MTKKHPTLGAIYALVGALLFGLNASSSKLVMAAGVSGPQLVILRSFATAFLAGLVLLLTNRRGFKVAKRELPMLLAFGIVGVALMQWAYSMAVSNLQIGIALLIEYSAIVWVPLVSWILFRTRVTPLIWVAVALVLTGLVVVSNLSMEGLNPVGLIFACMAAATLTVYFILGERIQNKRDSMSTLFYTMTISLVFWLALTPNSFAGLEKLPAHIWWLMAWVGVMGSFLPWLLSYLALSHLSATGVGIASTAETIFAFGFGLLILGEQISLMQYLGGALVIAGIVTAQLSRKTNL